MTDKYGEFHVDPLINEEILKKKEARNKKKKKSNVMFYKF